MLVVSYTRPRDRRTAGRSTRPALLMGGTGQPRVECAFSEAHRKSIELNHTDPGEVQADQYPSRKEIHETESNCLPCRAKKSQSVQYLLCAVDWNWDDALKVLSEDEQCKTTGCYRIRNEL